ncbi:MAG TPA: hypothetical protein VE130_15555 [Nitrososphaeraceae archaeon]|nr:hypothetical protein [Nitrososphaeraceae archaeon]
MMNTERWKIGILGLVMIIVIVTNQEYVPTFSQETGNQTGNQTIETPAQEEFEEGEEIGEEETL